MLLLCQLCRNGFELQELTSYNCLHEVRAHTRKRNFDGFALSDWYLENILHQVLQLNVYVNPPVVKITGGYNDT